EERIAAELLLKLGLGSHLGPSDVICRRQRTATRAFLSVTFDRNHAQAVLACDFFVTVTASFRVLYVFVIMEVGTRRITHFNVTAHPTAEWTLQQFRETITGERPPGFIIHDRDSVYSSGLDFALKAMGLSVLKTPF